VGLPPDLFFPLLFSRRNPGATIGKERNITIESRGLDAAQDAGASRRASVSGATGPGPLAEFERQSQELSAKVVF